MLPSWILPGVKLFKENHHWTYGITYRLKDVFKGQLNCLRKKTKERGEPDRKDNILFVNVQFAKG